MKREALARAVVAVASSLGLSSCSALPGWMVLQGKSAITDHRHFDNAPIAKAPLPSALPSAPAPLQWPDGLAHDAVERLLAETAPWRSS